MTALVRLHKSPGTVLQALRFVFGSRGYVLLSVLSFGVLLAFYLMVLPATETGGAIGPVALPFLTTQDVILALIMSGLLALTLPLGIYAWRSGAGGGLAGSASGSIAALIAPLLCCSPILPLAIAAIAGILPAAGAAAAPLQGFIATHELEFYLAAIALMSWGLYGNAKRVLYCDCRMVE